MHIFLFIFNRNNIFFRAQNHGVSRYRIEFSIPFSFLAIVYETYVFLQFYVQIVLSAFPFHSHVILLPNKMLNERQNFPDVVCRP